MIFRKKFCLVVLVGMVDQLNLFQIIMILILFLVSLVFSLQKISDKYYIINNNIKLKIINFDREYHFFPLFFRFLLFYG